MRLTTTLIQALVLALAAPDVMVLADDATAETALSDYLPSGVSYSDAIPTPADVLGHEVGEYHVRHDRLLAYFRRLAEVSPRVTLERYGLTHERRELVLATITSEENHARIDEIREQHLAALAGDDEAAADGDRPLVVWMGYSVHGNESSGSNASLVVGYHLAAATGEDIDELLRRAVILVDPCINPDGFSRFAQWANSHRGHVLVGDPLHREHLEVWPGGRTNHYWFDLNRDWLLLTHPESRGRIAKLHEWKPNILTDFHEMGTNSTYFFQPGVPDRQNPNTPKRNLELTREIAKYHAVALDGAGSLYYTEERFDDFYYGKGSTYPDVNGAIGILFEQASSRGHVQETKSGRLLTFPFTIRNQFLTSLSTLEAAVAMRKSLLDYQVEFYETALTAVSSDSTRAYVFGASRDPAREFEFLDILARHEVEVHRLARTVERDKVKYTPSNAYIVPIAQRQSRLVRALFERRTRFKDNTFYDVSTWNLPLCFGLPHFELKSEAWVEFVGATLDRPSFPATKLVDRDGQAEQAPYAYLFSWRGYYAARALHRLLRAGARASVSTRGFEAVTDRGKTKFAPGTIVVPLGIQSIASKRVAELVAEAGASDGVVVHRVSTGLTLKGIDLGSPSIAELKAPAPLVVVGGGVSGYEAGEVWHLLDRRFEIPVSMVEIDRLRGADLERYTHIVLVNGRYSAIPDEVSAKIRGWVSDGGVLIAIKNATKWAETEILERKKETSEKKAAGDTETASKTPPKVERFAYGDYEKHLARTRIAGALFEASIDATHPIGFGYSRPTIALFRNSSGVMETDRDPFATVVQYTGSPLLSGYASDDLVEKIARTAAVCASRQGEGAVVRIVDNPNFRGVCYGTNKLFLNALFFGHVIRRTGPLAGAD